MNGFANRDQKGFDARGPPPLRPTITPRGPALVESYRQDGLDGFERERPRFNPLNPGRVQSSVLVDLQDPVQVHLLTETALLDSKEYEILSQEEVDDLKKQWQVLNQRIEQTRANLAIQSKYRDAAISMSKLYSPSRADGKRKSLLGHRHSGSIDAAREAEHELSTIQKKCEDLASELWALEKRAMEPQRRLLEHTAGILQLAHKTSKPTVPSPKGPLVNGVPASPESMYTTSNGRDSMDFLDEGIIFDEASLYRSFDLSSGFDGRIQPAIEIPTKSPIREQNKQLAEESERLREENRELRARTESLLSQINELGGSRSDQRALISDTEGKLESFNRQLRELIVAADPANNMNYQAPPSGQLEPGDMIGSHLDYLEGGLAALAEGQSDSVAVTGKLQILNTQIQGLLAQANPNQPPPPDASLGVDEQFGYLQNSLQMIEEDLRRAADAVGTNSADRQKTEQSEAVLMGLWDIIQSGYADMRQRKHDRRKARLDKGLEPDEADMSDGESFDPDEVYSLQAFSTKIQWLYTQATKLQEQKGVLKRQIKQQRELNSRSDSEKDEAIRTKTDELEEARILLQKAEKETDSTRAQLSRALQDLEEVQNNRTEESAAIDEAREQLRERNAKVASLEADTRNTQARLATAEANIQAITTQLQEASEAKDAADKAVKDKENELKAKEEELKAKEEELGQMMSMVAELKMEATLAKAELDGAYGSRKERAAEVAALHNSSESAKMQSRVHTLEKELKATAEDLTNVVKQSLESEKKIGELEGELDRARAEHSKIKEERDHMDEELEKRLREATSDLEERHESEIARLRREKEQILDDLDKERLRSASFPVSPGGTKTSFLTDSYRVGLRAERRKYEEQLRAEQMLRRKIEDELKALKRAQGPGKSPLSPSRK
ncbi:Up-regulated during septation-domain-containing protein [Durotheca rogersii]|uniref:Up-regulated during septation-domain-containing protein n=1 Tax=Durotheca rogersii TaxID=419775 RepID=UPI00221F05DD|nr:Up-regulated during septation-domain-containing protein [Durotheca rogersii]KAI5858305.1 Up-regulated during septation-domain-containing protein [Durotheca rogersii]